MKVVIQGQGEISLTQREFVASGGEGIAFVAPLCYARGYGLHLQNPQTRKKNLQEVWEYLSKSRDDRWSDEDAEQPDLLPGVFTFRGEEPPTAARSRGDEPRAHLPDLRQDVHLPREAQQQRRSSEGGLQRLSIGLASKTTEGTGSRTQRREVRRVRLFPVPRCSCVPPLRSDSEGVHGLSHVRVGVASPPGRDRQVHPPLRAVSRRATRGAEP